MSCGLLRSMIQSICHAASLREHGRTDRGPAWGGDSRGAKDDSPDFLTDSTWRSPNYFRHLLPVLPAYIWRLRNNVTPRISRCVALRFTDAEIAVWMTVCLCG